MGRRQSYTILFKQETIDEVKRTGNCREVARLRGVNERQVRNWLKEERLLFIKGARARSLRRIRNCVGRHATEEAVSDGQPGNTNSYDIRSSISGSWINAKVGEQ